MGVPGIEGRQAGRQELGSPGKGTVEADGWEWTGPAWSQSVEDLGG